MADKYKLTYFNLRGRAEPIRLLFAAGGIPNMDVRVSQEDWAKLKPNTPFGGLPILETEGHTIGQSLAIARFVAHEGGLVPKKPVEAALADSIVDTSIDIREKFLIPWVFEKDDKKKSEMADKMKKDSIPKIFEDLEKILGKHDYFVDNKLSWADIVLFSVIEMMDAMGHGDVVDRFPKIRNHSTRVAGLPEIAQYLKVRPVTDG